MNIEGGERGDTYKSDRLRDTLLNAIRRRRETEPFTPLDSHVRRHEAGLDGGGDPARVGGVHGSVYD
jgi:hypothetical protein